MHLILLLPSLTQPQIHTQSIGLASSAHFRADGRALLSHELEALREAARLARISRIHGPNRLFLVDLV